MRYTPENPELFIKDLFGKKNATFNRDMCNKLRNELCVHSKGHLFEKIITVFENEEPGATKHVLNTYEPITKDGFWKGVNNIARIFSSTEIAISGNEEILKNSHKIVKEYTDDWINTSVAEDPNSVHVWLPDEDSDEKWSGEFIKSEFIEYKDDECILFLDIESSPHILKEQQELKEVINTSVTGQHGKKIEMKSYMPRFSYEFIGEKIYIFISKSEILQIEVTKDGEYKITPLVTFENELPCKPYSYTGTEEVYEDVYHSPASGYIAWGNIALIEHRTFRAVSALYSYPRLIESESACDNAGCISGKVSCDITEGHPEGTRDCERCQGTGKLSLQGPYNVYTFKQDENNPNAQNIKPHIEFVTPDIGILEYNSKAYLSTLQKAEESLYVQQRQATGNVESAKSRELQLSEMYAWLNRIADYFYSNLKHAIQIRHYIDGAKEIVGIEKPISFAIINEIEAFDMLQTIVNSTAPNILKSSQIEGFLNKYTSRSNPLIKKMDVLKQIDPFIFYSTSDFESQYNNNLINEDMAFVHINAFPILSKMVAIEPELLTAETEYIVGKLEAELAKIKPINPIKNKVATLLG